MKLRTSRWWGVAFSAVCLLAVPVLASPVNIDTFDSSNLQPVLYFGPAVAGTDSPLPLLETIGGARDYSVTGTGGGVGMATMWINSGQAGLGTITMRLPFSGQWSFAYGSGADLNADLVNNDGAPNSGLLIEMISAEYNYTVDVAVTSNGSTVNVPLARLADSNPHSIFVPFASFAGINFNDVDKIGVTWTGLPDGDYVVGNITANVPEPATLTLLIASGVVGLLRRR